MPDQRGRLQEAVAKRYATDARCPIAGEIVGVAANHCGSLWPVHGLRHPPAGRTCGWYLWAGEDLSQADDLFSPLHVEHLDQWRPEVLAYLGLPAGWRFLIAPGHEDVWFDASLL